MLLLLLLQFMRRTSDLSRIELDVFYHCSVAFLGEFEAVSDGSKLFMQGFYGCESIGQTVCKHISVVIGW